MTTDPTPDEQEQAEYERGAEIGEHVGAAALALSPNCCDEHAVAFAAGFLCENAAVLTDDMDEDERRHVVAALYFAVMRRQPEEDDTGVPRIH